MLDFCKLFARLQSYGRSTLIVTFGEKYPENVSSKNTHCKVADRLFNAIAFI